jgi:hypothetical protein
VAARSEALRVLHITPNFTPCQESWGFVAPKSVKSPFSMLNQGGNFMTAMPAELYPRNV